MKHTEPRCDRSARERGPGAGHPLRRRPLNDRLDRRADPAHPLTRTAPDPIHRRLPLGLAAGLFAAAFSLPLFAADPPRPRVSLRWSAPEGCPAGARVVAEVDRLLGESGARPPTPLEVSAVVTDDPAGGLRVRLDAGNARVRELHAASCEALADATAVILALMIDPTAVASAPPAAPAPAAPSSAAPSASAVPAAPPSPPSAPPAPASAPPAPASAAPSVSTAPDTSRAAAPPSTRSRVPAPRFHLLAWALADVGSLPGVSFAAGGTAALSLGAFRFELGAGVWPSRAATSPQRATAGGDISLVAGAAGACYSLLAPGAFELAPCLAFELGRIHAAGYGVTMPGEGSALWSALKPGARFAWSPVSRVALVLRLDAAVPFARPSFVLSNLGPVHRSGPLAGRAGCGVELTF
ncbi:Hypothetical protein A7982_00663 [Minicystis rosea]|nr:Hypothetical protein A7982_00663 [Minicystis rosea]